MPVLHLLVIQVCHCIVCGNKRKKENKLPHTLYVTSAVLVSAVVSSLNSHFRLLYQFNEILV